MNYLHRSLHDRLEKHTFHDCLAGNITDEQALDFTNLKNLTHVDYWGTDYHPGNFKDFLRELWARLVSLLPRRSWEKAYIRDAMDSVGRFKDYYKKLKEEKHQ